MKTIISNKESFNKKREEIIKDGAKDLHLLVDFDRTLTKGVINGKEVKSLMEFFRSGPYISKEYAEKSHALANTYRPFEHDPKLSIEEKKKKMVEWWTKHFELLIESGLNKKHLEKMVEEIEKAGFLEFRDGALEFFNLTKEKKIPVIIISSSGLGVTIEMILKKHDAFSDNISVITNEYGWDKEGNAISVKKPIIHVFNKDETSLKSFPKIHDKIEDRKNVVLIGDSLGDLGMATGSDCKNLLSFGFLEEKVNENLELYQKSYDAILLDNSDFSEINKLVKDIK
jgi:5'-nucleotidase